jgi:LysM repeat protein
MHSKFIGWQAMINRVKTNVKAIASVFMILSLILVGVSTDLRAQPRTYTVKKGDTLWSICEKYYGDPNLWPKLWEMNPFVTNPHLLKPGDVLTLMEKEDIYKQKAIAEKPSGETAKPVFQVKGIDLSTLTNVATMGYLSLTEVEPWGVISGSTKSKLGAEKGDKIFINFMNRSDVKPGDEFRVALPIPVRNPITDRPMGNVISIRGAVVVKERLQETYFLAEVTEVYMEFGVNAMVMPFEPMSKCVLPIATDPKLYGTIVALKDDRSIIGSGAIAYLDAGFKDGIQRGQVFEVVRISRVPYTNWTRNSFQENMAIISAATSKEEYLADLWKKLEEGKNLYEFPVGKLMVVESRPDSSTAIMLSTTEDLYTGAFIKGCSWSETPGFLAHLPSCPVD